MSSSPAASPSPVFPPVALDASDPDVKLAYAEATRQFGGVINLFKTAAHAPRVLLGLLKLNAEISASGQLTPAEAELVAMRVSAMNRCDYCVNVHMAVGKKMKLSEKAMLDAMAGVSDDPKHATLLNFVSTVVRERGQVSAGLVEAMRGAGYSSKAMIEVLGVVGLYTTLQYVRHLTGPAHDFPPVPAFDPKLHGK
jgi:uncharacterized peroxidase-related enzyme